jgi:hypothetical protein
MLFLAVTIITVQALIKHNAMKACGGSEMKFNSLAGGQLGAPAALSLQRNPRSHYTGGWMEHGSSLDPVAKISISTACYLTSLSSG